MINPREGWYSKQEWLATFRPTGSVKMVISAKDLSPVEIEVKEMICDLCNEELGKLRPDTIQRKKYSTLDPIRSANSAERIRR